MNFSKFLSFKGILLGIGIFAIIIAVLGFSGKLPFFNYSQKQKLTGTLNVWGTVPQDSMLYFVESFNKEAKSYSMIYTEIPYDQFNQRLTKALADGVAPDLVLAPSEIAFANLNRIQSVSVSSISESSFRNSFIDMSSLLIGGEGYVGLPVSVDPLVLYYNRDILSSNGFATPPATWMDLYRYEEKITRFDYDGNIVLSTIALGTYDNIPHISDIILSMIFQRGQIPVEQAYRSDGAGNMGIRYNVLTDEINTETGISALNSAFAFTKDFSDTQKSTYNWNAKMPSALTQFTSGNLAFYIGFASEAGYIKSANQKLYFDYTYLPQTDGSQIFSTYGRLFTIFMLRTSPNQNLAYEVLLSLATGPFSQELVSVTGGISALKANIASAISSGSQAGEIFGSSALISKGFYDLHRQDLEALMRESIRQIYNLERSTVEASEDFSKNLQAAYDGEDY